MGLGMGALTESTPQFATEMARIQLEAQMGKEPDRARVRQLADELDTSYQKWEVLIAKLRMSDDFQSREYYKLTEAHMVRHGRSPEAMGATVRFQVECMRAFADGRFPPPPPPGLDLTPPKEGTAGGLMTYSAIEAEPFTGSESLFRQQVVRDEYEALTRDHMQLIKLGEQYGTFDPLGKVAFIDQIEAVEARWDVFFARFALVGGLNPDFKEQSEAFLSSMGLGAGEFRRLLRDAHDAMRRDAEAQRLQGL
mmetsp:Transcript_101438/g.327340  ORF Transcript_101438/g.327340 Transcript_101438/m.327340 type:complete len:252 (-) Transcript_101438:79-834(-)